MAPIVARALNTYCTRTRARLSPENRDDVLQLAFVAVWRLSDGSSPSPADVYTRVLSDGRELDYERMLP